MIKLNFIKIEKKFNNISLRERILICCALLVCVFSISYFWMFEPSMLKQEKANKMLQSSYQQEIKLDNKIEEIKLRFKKDPVKEINNKIAFSLQTIAALDKQLDDKLVKFIHAKKMPAALSKVLNKSPGVTLVSLTTLPVTVFQSPANAVDKSSADETQAPRNTFYKHTLEIQLTGSYNAVYQYLLNLEAVQEKFYWSVLTYKVADYPSANVMIQIYTLSDRQELVSG